MKMPLWRKKHTIKRAKFAFLSAGLLMIFFCSSCLANNLSIENARLERPDSLAGTVKVSFDISWDNSWRNSVNHDAVWVFVKYTADMGLTWKHATLWYPGVNPEGTWAGGRANTDMVVASDRKGCLITRSVAGAGQVEMTGVELTWDWKEDGLTAEDEVGVRVIGIEMVYVSEGIFMAGDGDGSLSSTYAFKIPGAGIFPVDVSAEVTEVSCASSPNDDIDAVPVELSGTGGLDGNAEYPTGFRPFYLMKYEITEGQWVDFFNMLSLEEKDMRDITGASGKNSNQIINRNTISRNMALASTLRPDRACGYLSWQDIAAYFDWAALRPLTELEFEKAARGINSTASKGEYAWGGASPEGATIISGFEGGSEVIENEAANVCYGDESFSGGDGGTGPLRVGIFATAKSSRVQAGAGYYGAMELSGNLWERTVTLGNPEGRAFKGTHGDGILGIDEGYEGNATNVDWPGYVSGQGVSAATGSGFRGGSWLEVNEVSLAISDRGRSATTSAARLPDSGGRGARTAPEF